ncbi:MAG: adenylate/guanylate cyclase domain-containing protein [Fimbriimonadaceae bacterium]
MKPDQNELAYIRHELRTPLNAIIGYSEMLTEDLEGGGLEEYSQDANRILTAGKNLLNTLNELLADESFGVQSKRTGPREQNPSSEAAATALEPKRSAFTGEILVVDDLEENRHLLGRYLERQGHQVSYAAGGEEALEVISRQPVDLVLLDVMMPGMSGPETLSKIKQNPETASLPVLMISALDEIDTVVRCIEQGAEDYLSKPFNPTLLRARLEAGLQKKRFADQEKAYLAEVSRERERADALLESLFPPSIVQKLKRGESHHAEALPDVTVVFADIAGFTRLSSSIEPDQLVRYLDELFSEMDQRATQLGVEKIKTIGDAYMAVTGLSSAQQLTAEEGAARAAQFALSLDPIVREFGARHSLDIGVRVGMHQGAVVAGVIGTVRYAFDLWGSTVNVAKRMEETGEVGRVQVSDVVAERLEGAFELEKRGEVEAKGLGKLQTYWLLPGNRS